MKYLFYRGEPSRTARLSASGSEISASALLKQCGMIEISQSFTSPHHSCI